MSLRWLTLLWLAPALGAAAVWALAALGRRELVRRTALFAAGWVLVYALLLWLPYRSETGLFRLAESSAATAFGIRYELAVDGVALALVWLNAFLTVLALLSWRNSSPGACACLLLLESAVNGVFAARDLFCFFTFWEAGLLPMFFIIGLWGGAERMKAALKFLLYTVFGSLFMLLGFLALVTSHAAATDVWTWRMAELSAPADPRTGIWIFLAIALGFAVKVPVFPLHSWLPDAHTEAPTAGSVLLAGILLKMGVYGFLRVLVPIFPELSREFSWGLAALGVVNIVYGALGAMGQSDLKRLVAFSSISHLGFCLLGLFSLTPQGISGGMVQLVSHGLTTGALFLIVGMLYERSHRRGIGDFGELAARAPELSFLFSVVMLASIGLPGLSGFVGELMSLAGAAARFPALAAAGLGGVVLSAAYFLPAYQRVFWAGAGTGSASGSIGALDPVERGMLWSLAGLSLLLGLYPAPLLGLFQPTVAALAAVAP